MFTKGDLKKECNLLCSASCFGFQVRKNWVMDRIWQKTTSIFFSSVNAESFWEYPAYWRIKPQPVKGWIKTFLWFRSLVQKENGLKLPKLQPPLKRIDVKDVKSWLKYLFIQPKTRKLRDQAIALKIGTRWQNYEWTKNLDSQAFALVSKVYAMAKRNKNGATSWEKTRSWPQCR